MRPPGTPSKDVAAGTDEEFSVGAAEIASELEALGRDLVSGEVPDAELLRRVEAFADLFLQPERGATD